MTSDVITEMLGLTADVAEGLLAAKDEGLSTPPDSVIRQIARLHEIATNSANNQQETAEAPTAIEETTSDTTSYSDNETESAVSEATEETVTEGIITDDAVIEDIVTEETATEDTVTEEIVTEEPVVEDNAAEDTVVENTVSKEPINMPTTDAVPNTPSPDDLRRAMSLNDLFLFRRALFGGSAAQMNRCLTAIAGCTDFDTVKRILQHDFGMNLRQPEAKSFMAAIEPFFAI